MRPLSFLLASALLLFSNVAIADAWYEIIRYSCDQKKDIVKVEYLGAYNEEGKKLKANMQEGDWNPWDLLVQAQDGNITSSKQIRRRCKLRGGSYEITLGPLPCNNNPQGRSGAMMMAKASIASGAKKLVSAKFGACEIGDQLITTSVAIHANSNRPIVEQKTANEYFR